MKTLPLRQLLRDPKKVKKLTLAGISVSITDGGKPLWVLSPPIVADEIASAEDDARRHQLWDEHFADLMSTPLSKSAMPSMNEVMRRAREDR